MRRNIIVDKSLVELYHADIGKALRAYTGLVTYICGVKDTSKNPHAKNPEIEMKYGFFPSGIKVIEALKKDLDGKAKDQAELAKIAMQDAYNVLGDRLQSIDSSINGILESICVNSYRIPENDQFNKLKGQFLTECFSFRLSKNTQLDIIAEKIRKLNKFPTSPISWCREAKKEIESYLDSTQNYMSKGVGQIELDSSSN